MVIQNGTIQPITGEIELDDYGEPIKSHEELGEAIPCNYQQVNQQRENSENEINYTSATYKVAIDYTDEQLDNVVLFGKRGRRLASCRVTATAYLDEVDAIELTCVRYGD